MNEWVEGSISSKRLGVEVDDLNKRIFIRFYSGAANELRLRALATNFMSTLCLFSISKSTTAIGLHTFFTLAKIYNQLTINIKANVCHIPAIATVT